MDVSGIFEHWRDKQKQIPYGVFNLLGMVAPGGGHTEIVS